MGVMAADAAASVDVSVWLGSGFSTAPDLESSVTAAGTGTSSWASSMSVIL